MNNKIDKEQLIKEVLEQGYIYAIVDVKDDGTQVIDCVEVYCFTAKKSSTGEIVSYFETSRGDFSVDDYMTWWWLVLSLNKDVDTSEDVIELAKAIFNSNIQVSYVDRLYWVDGNSAVKQLAQYLIDNGWHKVKE